MVVVIFKKQTDGYGNTHQQTVLNTVWSTLMDDGNLNFKRGDIIDATQKAILLKLLEN